MADTTAVMNASRRAEGVGGPPVRRALVGGFGLIHYSAPQVSGGEVASSDSLAMTVNSFKRTVRNVFAACIQIAGLLTFQY